MLFNKQEYGWLHDEFLVAEKKEQDAASDAMTNLNGYHCLLVEAYKAAFEVFQCLHIHQTIKTMMITWLLVISKRCTLHQSIV